MKVLKTILFYMIILYSISYMIYGIVYSQNLLQESSAQIIGLLGLILAIMIKGGNIVKTD